MTTILIILIPLCAIIAYCMCKHFASTKEYNPLKFDAEYIAKHREVEPVIKPTPIPMKHYVSYYFWCGVVIGGIAFVVYLVLNAID